MADKNFGVRGINFISDPGTPTISIASSTITYAGSLNLNSPTVAISTDVSIGGKIVSNVVVTNAYSEEYGVMYNNSLIVSIGATISGGNCILQATPQTGISGLTTYRFVRNTLL